LLRQANRQMRADDDAVANAARGALGEGLRHKRRRLAYRDNVQSDIVDAGDNRRVLKRVLD